MENWKAIPGYEGLYEVSDLGNVRNVRTGRILKPAKNSTGYLKVVLLKNGKLKNPKIHKLVAMAFLDHVPCGHKITVDHINGIRIDNKLENLELVSMRENTNRGYARRKTSSEFPGVSFNKRDKKWIAQIYVNGKLKYLGLFTNELEAAQAYQTALQQINN